MSLHLNLTEYKILFANLNLLCSLSSNFDLDFGPFPSQLAAFCKSCGLVIIKKLKNSLTYFEL